MMHWKLPAVIVTAGTLLAVAAAVGAQTPPPSTLDKVCATIDADPGYVCTTEVPPSTTTSMLPTTTTSPTTTPSTTTTSTVPPSTTSTTMAMPMPTTTTLPPTTPPTTAPAGAQFSATFDTPADFYNRFDTYAGNFIDAQHHRTSDYLAAGGDTPAVVHGDHDMSCGDPTTLRDLNVRDPDTAKYFWYCAPTGPASGHIMTGFDTTGYAIMSFSPKQSFTNITKVCWDVNATEEGGGKWTFTTIVPLSGYQQFAPRLDFVIDSFQGDFNIEPADHPTWKTWAIEDFRGTQAQLIGPQTVFLDGTAHVTTDKAARFRHCVANRPGGGATLTVARPGGTTDTFTLPQALPTGAVKVIFQDVMYDPPKREGYAPTHVTWHWDNVVIS